MMGDPAVINQLMAHQHWWLTAGSTIEHHDAPSLGPFSLVPPRKTGKKADEEEETKTSKDR